MLRKLFFILWTVVFAIGGSVVLYFLVTMSQLQWEDNTLSSSSSSVVVLLIVVLFWLTPVALFFLSYLGWKGLRMFGKRQEWSQYGS